MNKRQLNKYKKHLVPCKFEDYPYCENPRHSKGGERCPYYDCKAYRPHCTIKESDEALKRYYRNEEENRSFLDGLESELLPL